MTSPSAADVEARLRRPLSDEERAALPDLVDDAGDLLEAYLGQAPAAYPLDAQAIIGRVWARMVTRGLAQAATDPNGEVSSLTNTTGPYMMVRSYREGTSGADVWLTRVDKLKLARFRPSMVSIDGADWRHRVEEWDQ